jgi:hypothetical protein
MPPKETSEEKKPSLAQFDLTGANKEQKSLHTYASDLADVIKSGQGSAAKIAIAEADKKRKAAENKSPLSTKNILFTGIASLLIIGAGALVIWALYKQQIKTVPIEETSFEIRPLVRIDTQEGLDITEKKGVQLKDIISRKLKSVAPRLNTIEQIYFSQKDLTSTTVVTTEQLFSMLELKTPETLKRTLSSNFTLGTHAFSGNGPFLLLQVDSYPTAFTGMMTWEQSLFEEWYQLFGIDVSGDNKYLLGEPFRDKVIQNQDTRAIIDKTGTAMFFYAFLGEKKDLLIITTKESTLKEVLNRLTAVKKISQ